MAFSISGYTDPGSYIEEVVQPGAVSISSERVLCIVAIAPRTRRYSNEAVIRGKVYEEALSTLALVGTNYEQNLANTGNRDRNNAILYKNGNAEPVGTWSFAPASLTGAAVAGAAMDTTTLHKLTLSVDGKDPVTLTLTTKAPATTLTTIATELNAAIALVAAYGTAYNAIFTTLQTGAAPNDTLRITSPITTSASDVKIFLSYEDVAVTYEDMASTVSAAAWAPTTSTGVQAATTIRIPALYYSATATYTIDYVSVDTQTDALTNADATTPLSDLVSIGSYPSADSYTEDTDFEDNSNTVDWYIAGTTAQATLTGIAGPYAIVLATNDHLWLSINGLTTIDVTLSAGAAQTAIQVAEDINLALNASAVYGPDYAYVASNAAGSIKLDVPGQFENYLVPHGAASSLTLVTGTTNAATTLFNVITSQLPYSVYGVGSRPGFGTTYYCTYDVTRSSDDYDIPTRVYNADQLFTYTSPLTSVNYTVNKLAVAGEIAFENYAPSLWLQQVNDSTTPGSPTQAQINTAIDNCEQKSGITDIVVIDTSEATQAYLMGHVSNMSTLTEKKYRRGWYGCARSTSIGDPDTADTFVYRASRTLQPAATSTGRGRQLLVAPAEADRTVTLQDGSEVDVEVDGSYLATAVAALQTSLPSPSSTMVNRTIRGFKTDSTFETYLKAERHTLASNGVCVITLDAGNLVLKDPLTTERGGVVQFEEPMASCQKDSVTNTINTLLDANVVGVVPDDLADFISDVKTWIMLGLQAAINAGDIAPFRDNSGNYRDVDPATDIQVWQDTTDPRVFLFNYWFNLKYPAKRFFGQYSVDNPFFSPTT